MIYVAIGMLVLVVLLAFWLLRLFVEADPAQLAVGIGRLLLVVGATLSVVAIIAGLISERVPVVLAGAGGLGVVWFGATRRRRRESAARATMSAVETDYLKMRLDHETQTIFGTVRRGAFQGRELADCREQSSCPCGRNAGEPIPHPRSYWKVISIGLPPAGGRR